MKILIKYILLFCFVCGMCLSQQKGQAQNLVDNWSFEDTLICPTTLNQIPNAEGWEVCSGSPDYYNGCNQNVGPGPINVSTPQNTVDYQVAKSGNSYAGLLTYSVLSPNVREFMGRPLNQIMQIGQKYFVSFYVVRAFNDFPYKVNVANNKIGVLFSTFSQTPPNAPFPNNISQVYSDSIIIDTLGWTQIKGTFIADSNYQYIGIGNYFDGSNTSFIQFDTNKVFAYYFFDDICVSPDSLYCDLLSGIFQHNQLQNEINQPYLSQTMDEITISSEQNMKTCTVYNSLGQIVFNRESFKEKQVILNTTGFSTGIYFFQVQLENGRVYNLKGFRQ